MAQGTPVKHKKKTKSVLKNIRQAGRRAVINRMNRTRVRTAVRRMRAALSAADAARAEKLASATFSELDKAIKDNAVQSCPATGTCPPSLFVVAYSEGTIVAEKVRRGLTPGVDGAPSKDDLRFVMIASPNVPNRPTETPGD